MTNVAPRLDPVGSRLDRGWPARVLRQSKFVQPPYELDISNGRNGLVCQNEVTLFYVALFFAKLMTRCNHTAIQLGHPFWVSFMFPFTVKQSTVCGGLSLAK